MGQEKYEVWFAGIRGLGARKKCLLHELDWFYTKTLDKHGVYNYYLRSSYAGQVYDIIGPNKIIPKWILNIGSDNLRELVKYYSFYIVCLYLSHHGDCTNTGNHSYYYSFHLFSFFKSIFYSAGISMVR